MADKRFYEAAASEIRAGNMDEALWIKVNAEFPASSNHERQATYIRLRANELAYQAAGNTVRHTVLRFAPGPWWQWVLYLVAVYVIAVIVETVTTNTYGEGLTYVVFWGLIVVVLISGIMRRKAKRGMRSPSDP